MRWNRKGGHWWKFKIEKFRLNKVFISFLDLQKEHRRVSLKNIVHSTPKEQALSKLVIWLEPPISSAASMSKNWLSSPWLWPSCDLGETPWLAHTDCVRGLHPEEQQTEKPDFHKSTCVAWRAPARFNRLFVSCVCRPCTHAPAWQRFRNLRPWRHAAAAWSSLQAGAVDLQSSPPSMLVSVRACH